MLDYHVIQKPDSVFKDKYRELGLYPPKECPFCGNCEHNDFWTDYEFTPTSENTLLTRWHHDCSLKERINEVGIRGVTVRRYHNIVRYAECDSCGAVWRGNIIDDQYEQSKYGDIDRDFNVRLHIISNVFIIGVLALLLYMIYFGTTTNTYDYKPTTHVKDEVL